MEITEVRIKLMEGAQDRLLGFCSITIDRAFVVRDLKIIKGSRGFFVAMPSRKLTDRCQHCSNKNHLRAAFCSNCGKPLSGNRSLKSSDGRAKLYADIAHPIHSECRDLIQEKVLQAYEEEQVLAQQPGYVCRYDDFGEYDLDPEETASWDEEFAAGDRQRRLDAAHAPPSPVPADSSVPDHAVRAPRSTSEEFGSGLF